MIKQFATTIGLAMTLSAPAFAADAIQFDEDGTGAGGDVTVGSWDWFVSSATATDVIPTTGIGAEFTTYTHATLGGMADGVGDPLFGTGLGVDYEITFVAGFDEQITDFTQSATSCVGTDCSFSQTIQLGDPASQATSFFEVYWDDTMDASSLAGTGFNDGELILSGSVASVSGIFTSNFSFTDTNGNGQYDVGVDPLNSVDLDQNANGDDWAGQQTIEGEGATTLAANITSQNFDYIKTDVTNLVFDLEFNTSNILPFNETNPSQSYWNGAGFGIPNLGEVNGAATSGPDIIFQSDANNSFNTFKEVPEPKTILLFALGLLLLAASNRRRQAAQLMA
jgi:PEP-CTERM motif